SPGAPRRRTRAATRARRTRPRERRPATRGGLRSARRASAAARPASAVAWRGSRGPPPGERAARLLGEVASELRSYQVLWRARKSQSFAAPLGARRVDRLAPHELTSTRLDHAAVKG